METIIVTYNEYGLLFHVIIRDDDFVLCCESLNDCYLNEHLQSYKNFDHNVFSWSFLNAKDIENSVISHSVILSDGASYIVKKWI